MVSVILSTHNPNPGRLARTLSGLRAQNLDKGEWELVIIDNASLDCAAFQTIDLTWHPLARIFREERLGLTSARLRGFAESRGEILVLVDDDNVLASDYLAIVVREFANDNSLGAIGGRSLPEFESHPPSWTREFDGLLALRDPGDSPTRATWSSNPPHEYPSCAPIGAGMALRRAGADAYVKELACDEDRRAFDRAGNDLVSGGDNDLVMTCLETGFAVAYVPELRLTHLIPAERMQLDYLARLNRGIAKSWVQVLHKHQANPWIASPAWTVPLRQIKAWFAFQAWQSPAAYIRWQGACGHCEGRASLPSVSS